jgi:Na+-transporting methylmalonyl-CoA/oxaloacetate decarboxylase gamma subunit
MIVDTERESRVNNRFLGTFVITLLIILVAVVIILGVAFQSFRVVSPTATATPASAAASARVHNDTANAVRVQDCTGALRACASRNMGTAELAAGASGTERGATGLRILSLHGSVVGCIPLSGVPNGSTVPVSSAKTCP